MKPIQCVALILTLTAVCAANAQVSVRILLGVGDAESVRWDGTIAACSCLAISTRLGRKQAEFTFSGSRAMHPRWARC